MRYVSLLIPILAVVFLLTVAAMAVKSGNSPVTTDNQGNAQSMTKNASQKDMNPDKPVYSKSGYDITPYSKEKVAELAKKLTKEQYDVTQDSGTEPAFCGNLVDNHKDGIYTCVVCGLPLFRSDDKFTSGTGWPSFFQPFDPAHIKELKDTSAGMIRTEIRCARCGAHLGHVFDDGPKPTGLRFCLNSAALNFIEKGQPVPSESQPVKTETAYFAGGCFWGIEHYLQEGPGVVDAISGYMGGHTPDPTYPQVCTDKTGYAETVKVIYDPSKITYDRLLKAFFDMHNPTELNYQGPDVGTQYRSAIFTTTDEQMKEANAYIAKLTAEGAYDGKKIVTTVESAPKFYKAEDYHQDYIDKTGHACWVTDPW